MQPHPKYGPNTRWIKVKFQTKTIGDFVDGEQKSFHKICPNESFTGSWAVTLFGVEKVGIQLSINSSCYNLLPFQLAIARPRWLRM